MMYEMGVMEWMDLSDSGRRSKDVLSLNPLWEVI